MLGSTIHTHETKHTRSFLEPVGELQMTSNKLRLSMSKKYGVRPSESTHGARVNRTRWFHVRNGLWTRVIANKIYTAERVCRHHWSLTVISTDVDIKKGVTMHKTFKAIREEVAGVQVSLFDK